MGNLLQGGSQIAAFGYVQEAAMQRIKLGTSFTVFLLFFGVAALEAFQTRNWIKAALWLAIGGVFLVADNLKNDG
jgi:hypothetical protein